MMAEVIKKPKSKRLLHLEFMRILAIFFVLFNHTGTDGFFLFSITSHSVKQWLYLCLSIFCKFAVPVFYMISGALLLKKEESIKDIYRKRVLKFAVILFVISAVYWAYKVIRMGQMISLKEFLTSVYTSNMSVPLWYLYSYLAILMMLPLLRRLVSAMKDTDYIYLAGMSIVLVGIVPIVDYFMFQGQGFLNSRIKGALFTTYNIVFFVMGYYFEHVMPQKYRNKKVLILGVVLSILSIFLCAYMTLYKGQITGVLDEGRSQTFHDVLIAITAYTIYLASKMFFDRVSLPDWLSNLMVTIGGTTFGIYMLEAILRKETKPIFYFLQPAIKTLPACLVWLVCCLVIGAVLVWLLKKIPIVNKMF